MRRLATLLVLLLVTAAPASAQDAIEVTVEQLLNRAADINGRVSVEGELIGDYGFRRDGFMWTQLNGDAYAYRPVLDGGALVGGNIGVAVRIPESMADNLAGPGGYRERGPLVRVTGDWKYHDPDRGGETYVDVISLEVLEPGHSLAEHPNYWILGAGVLLIVCAAWLRRGSILLWR